MRAAVVIPARDEQDAIGAVVCEARSAMPDARVIVVDDASHDCTAARAQETGADVLLLRTHAGYAGALRAGYRSALEEPLDAVLQMDGDGQHRAADLPRLMAGLEACDLVLGSRFMGPSPGYRIPAVRRAGMAACRWMAREAGGLDLTDPTSGLRALRPALAGRLADQGFPSGLTETSLLIHLHRAGFRITEIPVRMRASQGHSMHAGVAGATHLARISWAVMGQVTGRADEPARAPEPARAART
ncbi:MAG: glycosyltransferase family 2 protein [Actinobacteria bacterium]|nr:glycosyltransferase family 2 protein [Actinomycetota bacterium]